jgi:ParB family transcriptional regulator, chromosome partitioning protein
MAKIVDSKDIPLDKLVIGKGQIRLQEVGAGIKELADSISAKGLLQPIVVAPIEGDKFEILVGQRRFLAHKELKATAIRAQILDEAVDETEAKVLSLSENMVRRDISRKDKIDVCTVLYKKYGSMKDVAEATGLPYKDVSQFVKYDRLKPDLKGLVDSSEVGLDVALKAQDAAEAAGAPEEAVMLAKELEPMSGAARNQLVKAAEESSGGDLGEVVEESKEQTKVTQVIVTLGPKAHEALQKVAAEEGTTQDDAAGELLGDALRTRGYAV